MSESDFVIAAIVALPVIGFALLFMLGRFGKKAVAGRKRIRVSGRQDLRW